MFPFLFVTIACGACSGFHGLVCSGTTSKQISKESHCQSVGYGGMLLEAFVAVIALATVMFVSTEGIAGRGPGKLYGDGIGLSDDDQPRGSPRSRSPSAMAFSSFISPPSTSAHPRRYIMQERFARTSPWPACWPRSSRFRPCPLLLGPRRRPGQAHYAVLDALRYVQSLRRRDVESITVWLRAGSSYGSPGSDSCSAHDNGLFPDAPGQAA